MSKADITELLANLIKTNKITPIKIDDRRRDVGTCNAIHEIDYYYDLKYDVDQLAEKTFLDYELDNDSLLCRLSFFGIEGHSSNQEILEKIKAYFIRILGEPQYQNSYEPKPYDVPYCDGEIYHWFDGYKHIQLRFYGFTFAIEYYDLRNEIKEKSDKDTRDSLNKKQNQKEFNNSLKDFK